MHIIVKVSLIASLVLLLSTIARIFGILDKEYINIIMNIVLVIQAILLTMFIIIIIMKRRNMNGVKIIRYQIDNKLIKGNADILPEYMFPTNPRKLAFFKVFIEIEDVKEPPEFGILKMGTDKTSHDIMDHVTNVNSGIMENSFIFDADIIVRPGEKINFRLKKDTIVKWFFLGEFYIP